MSFFCQKILLIIIGLLSVNQSKPTSFDNYSFSKRLKSKIVSDPMEHYYSRDWKNQYLRLHRHLLSGPEPAAKYLVSISSTSGIADSLLSIVTHLLLAILSRRAFKLVDLPQIPSLLLGFDSPHLNISVPSIQRQLIMPKGFSIKWRICNGISLFSRDQNITREHYNVSAYRLKQVDYCPFKAFESRDLTQFPFEHVVDRAAPLFMTGHKGFLDKIFSNPNHRAQLLKMGFRSTTALFNELFTFLFNLKPTVCKNNICEQMETQLIQAKRDNIIRIGVQIRTGDAVIRSKLQYNKTRAAFYFRCAEQLLASYHREMASTRLRYETEQKYLLFLISDSIDLRRDYKQEYGHKLLTDLDLVVRHVQPRGNNPANMTQFLIENPPQWLVTRALEDMYLFSLTDFKVCTRNSGFGKVAALMGNIRGSDSFDYKHKFNDMDSPFIYLDVTNGCNFNNPNSVELISKYHSGL